MKISYNYINGNGLIDDVVDTVSDELSRISLEMTKFSHNIRQLELEAFFEGSAVSEHEVYLENEGIFTKIGNAVIRIVKKISDAIKKITDKFFNRKKDVRTDIEKVNSIIQQHPELRDKICEGINKEWFTYKDVAAYEHDVVQLVNMIQKGVMDHKTFKEKMKERFEKFNNSGKTLITTAGTVAGLLLVFPKITGAYKKCKSSAESLLKKFKKDADTNNKNSSTIGTDGKEVNESYEMLETTTNDVDVANIVLQEVSKALTAITAELNKINKSEEALMNTLRVNVISKYDDEKKEDDKK